MYQKEELENEFLSKKYLEPEEISELAKNLGLRDKQVKFWFKNKRQKWNQTHDKSEWIKKERPKKLGTNTVL